MGCAERPAGRRSGGPLTQCTATSHTGAQATSRADGRVQARHDLVRFEKGSSVAQMREASRRS